MLNCWFLASHQIPLPAAKIIKGEISTAADRLKNGQQLLQVWSTFQGFKLKRICGAADRSIAAEIRHAALYNSHCSPSGENGIRTWISIMSFRRGCCPAVHSGGRRELVEQLAAVSPARSPVRRGGAATQRNPPRLAAPAQRSAAVAKMKIRESSWAKWTTCKLFFLPFNVQFCKSSLYLVQCSLFSRQICMQNDIKPFSCLPQSKILDIVDPGGLGRVAVCRPHFCSGNW